MCTSLTSESPAAKSPLCQLHTHDITTVSTATGSDMTNLCGIKRVEKNENGIVDELLSNKCAFSMETLPCGKERETQIIDAGTQ